jgi:hypothetical protein
MIAIASCKFKINLLQKEWGHAAASVNYIFQRQQKINTFMLIIDTIHKKLLDIFDKNFIKLLLHIRIVNRGHTIHLNFIL